MVATPDRIETFDWTRDIEVLDGRVLNIGMYLAGKGVAVDVEAKVDCVPQTTEVEKFMWMNSNCLTLKGMIKYGETVIFSLIMQILKLTVLIVAIQL